MNYDVLLYSAGSTQNMVPEGTYGLGGSSDAVLLRARLQQLSDGSVVNIVGGGLTGVELAAEIAQKHPQLLTRLVSRGRIAEGLSPAARRTMGRRLHAIGVELVENTAVLQCHQTSIVVAGGATLPSDCTIWAAGFRAPDLARNSSLPTDALGCLKVNKFLQCPQYPEIFGAGDAIAAPCAVAGHLRMSCAAALPLGAHAADNIVAALAGQEPAPVSAGYLLKCISLGGGTGLVQPVQSNDQPRRFIIRGRLGGLVKEQICTMTVKWLQKELRNSGSYSWPKGPARQSGAFQ